MNTERNKKKSSGNLIALILILVLCVTVSVSLLFGRVIPYTSAKFVNVHSLTENADTDSNAPSSDSGSGQTEYISDDEKHNPEFHMEAEEEIFKLFYDETGKITVIGPEGNDDKLIAPGTSNIYQFTLANTGDVALDYTMTMEAYVTGTDLWLPVEARVWDHTNKYLLGSPDNKVDVMELNTVNYSAELGAGRYAVFNLEWEWPFERGDDAYDTMLGDLAVGQDMELHIIIRTVAVHDDDPDDPNSGLVDPPHTGDDSQLILLCLLSAGSFAGLCIMIFALFKSDRKEKKQAE
ncbi:MAG: hypothetical protein J1E05_05665 [Eubacterium sp.]|nr:hypothetical protein [Eubacterium sp.]